MKVLAKAIIRIVLVFALINVLVILILGLVAVFREAYGGNTLFYAIAEIVMVALVGFVLLLMAWVNTDYIVRKVVGNTYGKHIEITTSNVNLMGVAMSMIGIWLIVSVIPDFLGTIARHYYYTSQLLYPNNLPADMRADEIQGLVVSGVKLVLGLWLFLGKQEHFKGCPEYRSGGQTCGAAAAGRVLTGHLPAGIITKLLNVSSKYLQNLVARFCRLSQ
jgi:hypothetical protein